MPDLSWRPCCAVAAAVAVAATACAGGRPRTVPFPCGGQRVAAVVVAAVSDLQAGEIVAIVEMPWQGTASVSLDAAPPAETNRMDRRFDFRHVSAGRHVLTTHALGFEPVMDTVYLSERTGVAVWIRPQRLAVCPLAR